MQDIENHFQLKEQPFRLSPDPRFLFLSDQVKEAVAKCEYMAANRVGPLYIYGPIGSGKTSILRHLLEQFGREDKYRVCNLLLANIKTSNSLLRSVMEEFDVKTARAYDRSLKNFQQFLITTHREGRIPLLLMDESQNLTRDMLRLIHALLSFETHTEKLLQIILVGQEELRAKVERYPELSSRMFPVAINAMSAEDLQAMIEFRWMVAGGKEGPFATPVYHEIFAYSKGLPRDALKICGEALRFKMARGKQELEQSEVLEIAEGLNLSR
jgi:general secretion pathway protein A